MPFIPHTEAEIKAMLDVIGAVEIEDLFDEIPANLRSEITDDVDLGISEMEISQIMQKRALQDSGGICFIGAGAYEHHIPAAVWQIATRGEFYTAYTPYQAEASQGTLQLLYEYQSMMTALLAMEVSNASMYDGASALAEAVLMAVRANRKSKSRKILIPQTLHPAYRKVVKNIVQYQKIEMIELPFDIATGRTDLTALEQYQKEDICALVINQPNFFGVLEEVDALTAWTEDKETLAIGVVNPLAMALLKPAGEWGTNGVDICVGDGQPLGIPLASGGPFYGFMCCKQKIVRQMPGRIIGKTVDLEGKAGFTLTLQAREQHIRRSKATSNICTNQGLMVTGSTIHMAMLGAQGLANVAASCHNKTNQLVESLTALRGVKPVFEKSPHFHERVIQLPIAPQKALKMMAAHNILGGYDLSRDYPELKNSLLVCATECRTTDDIANYTNKLERVIDTQMGAACNLRPEGF